jgi:type II secretory pathway pseudopilin PulG
MNSSSLTKRSAFTLVEVVISISVLSIVLFSMTALTITSIRSNQANINRLTAYYLAQEAVEGFRNMRDSNWMQNYSWDGSGDAVGNGLNDWGVTFDAEGFYVLSYQPGVPWALSYALDVDLLTNPSPQLYFIEDDLENVYYVHKGGNFYDFGTYEETFYSRYIELEYPDPTKDYFEITAVVSWNEYGETRSVDVSTQLSDWREGPL